jgi:hypothetical protein
MRKTVTLGTALLTFILLGGCATGQMERDAVFTTSSPTSLVMFGVDLQSEFKDPDLAFGKYDPVTGRVDSSRFYHAKPRTEQLTGGQSVLAYLSGRDSRPVGHVYFVVNLPPGAWFLWQVSAVRALGLDVWRSTTTVLSDGTILIPSKPGTALYLGEFVLKGKYSESITLAPAPRNFAAAQAELDTFSSVQVPLVDEEAEIRPFKCAEERLPRRECEPTHIVVSE